jgi:diaminopimelate decarboxylase
MLVTVAGPLCSGLDVFSQGAVMTPPDVGDLVAVLDVGAYGFTESMPLFLSHPVPAEACARASCPHPAPTGPREYERQIAPDW